MGLNNSKRILLREMLISQRKKIDLTQSQLAEKLKKPQSFVSKYESGERKLDVIEFIEVLEILECSPTEFIDDFYTKVR